MDLNKAVDLILNKYKNLDIDPDTLVELLERYEINTINRLAGFIGQCSVESGDFKYRKENLNYSAAALRKVFGKYFKTDEEANKYARKPELIASKVYANRMGNGDEASKDGYKYRGRGYIQLTGKNNYTAFADSIDISVEDAVEYLETTEGALESALNFWDRNNLNSWCDKDDIVKVSRLINGGNNGLQERKERYAYWKEKLEAIA